MKARSASAYNLSLISNAFIEGGFRELHVDGFLQLDLHFTHYFHRYTLSCKILSIDPDLLSIIDTLSSNFDHKL
jgi:hypothetical protein